AVFAWPNPAQFRAAERRNAELDCSLRFPRVLVFAGAVSRWEVSDAAMETIVVERGTRDCGNASRLEPRSKFRIISAAAVLRLGKCVVLDWQAQSIGGPSIIVLDSVSECPA